MSSEPKETTSQSPNTNQIKSQKQQVQSLPEEQEPAVADDAETPQVNVNTEQQVKVSSDASTSTNTAVVSSLSHSHGIEEDADANPNANGESGSSGDDSEGVKNNNGKEEEDNGNDDDNDALQSQPPDVSPVDDNENEQNGNGNESEAVTATATAAAEADTTTTTESNVLCGKKRRQRNHTRWGAIAKRQKRRRRWTDKKVNENETSQSQAQQQPPTTVTTTATTTTTTTTNPLNIDQLLSGLRNSPHSLSTMPVMVSQFFARNNVTAKQREIFFLKLKLQEANSKLFNPTVFYATRKHLPRSPSPEPVYDSRGIRTNTREVRRKQKAQEERAEIIKQLVEMDPSFQPPADYKPPKLTKRIDLPVDEYPDYNFFGLIVGPRGNTQKAMQQETGCRIAVRGRGACIGKPSSMNPDADAPMHVHITAPDQAAMDKACAIIDRLIHEVKTGGGSHKSQQLMQLATINGTLTIETRCRICGGLGHPIWKCPERMGEQWTPAQVQCRICGEMSHVTDDCKHFKKGRPMNRQPVLETYKTAMIDEEYSQFMAELTGDAPLTSFNPIAAIEGPGEGGGGQGQGQEVVGNNHNRNNNNNSNSNSNTRNTSNTTSVATPAAVVELDLHNVPPPCQAGVKPPQPPPQPHTITVPTRLSSQMQCHRLQQHLFVRHSHTLRREHQYHQHHNHPF